MSSFLLQKSLTFLQSLCLACLLFLVLFFYLFSPPQGLGEKKSPSQTIQFARIQKSLKKIELIFREKSPLLPSSLEPHVLAHLQSRFEYPQSRSCFSKKRPTRIARAFLVRYQNNNSFVFPKDRLSSVPKHVMVNSGLALGFGSFLFYRVEYSKRLVQRRVEGYLQGAERIVFTESGPLGMSLAARSVHIYHFRDALFLLEGQRRSFRMRQSGFPPAVLETIPLHSSTKLRPIAPGVILWQPDFLRKDEQWVWVRLKNGRTYLVLGNDWPSRECLFGKKAPPRIWFIRQGIRPENYRKAKKALRYIRRYFLALRKPIKIIVESR